MEQMNRAMELGFSADSSTSDEESDTELVDEVESSSHTYSIKEIEFCSFLKLNSTMRWGCYSARSTHSTGMKKKNSAFG